MPLTCSPYMFPLYVPITPSHADISPGVCTSSSRSASAACLASRWHAWSGWKEVCVCVCVWVCVCARACFVASRWHAWGGWKEVCVCVGVWVCVCVCVSFGFSVSNHVQPKEDTFYSKIYIEIYSMSHHHTHMSHHHTRLNTCKPKRTHSTVRKNILQ